ncbi:hypothetical protein [Microbacterium sp. NPDC091662]|uniref:hypothetical protein n=1 Tax=Microbacterium sp. NPDC091662 TaxID=3364211 RepID=UPI0038021C72
MTRGPGFTYAVFDEVRVFTPDVLRAMAPVVLPRAGISSLVSSALVADSYRASLLRRRQWLIADVARVYGVALYPHPRRAHAVVCAASDVARLRAAVMSDRMLSAVGRGYYLGLGGEIDVVSAADWTCDPLRVSLARWVAVSLVRPLRRVLALFGRTPAAHG